MREFSPFEISMKGRHLVEASAGTGKTYNITSLFIRYLIENQAEVDRILVLTYTKAATAELRERILARLRESIAVLESGKPPADDEFLNRLKEWVDKPREAVGILEAALHNFDEASIFTIHGFCQRALKEQSFLSGMPFDAELVNDDSDFVFEAVDDYWRRLVSRAEESETERIWLNILREEGYLPDNLTTMVSAGVGKPYLELTADQPAGDDRDNDLKELSRLFGEMAHIWPDSRNEIQRLLLSDAMNGNRYRETSVPGWIAELDRWLDGNTPSLNYFNRFDRFSIRFIRENGVKKGKEAPDHPFFHLVDQYIEQSERVRSWLPAFKKDLLNYVRRAASEQKLSRGVLGFDDLLVLLNRALNRKGSGPKLAGYLRNKFPTALVDEFQDTDPIQYDILTSIYGGNGKEHGLFLIGDPKQSIYSFRGADVFSYLEARSQVQGEQNYGLSRNFRSDSDLIEAVNRVFERLKEPFLIEEIGFEPASTGHTEVKPLKIGGEKPPPLNILQSASLNRVEPLNKGDARERAAEVTAESIAQLLNRGINYKATIGEEPVRARDIAVLVRTHDQADRVGLALERRGINSVQYSQKSVFDTDEAQNMELLLKAVAEPKNEQAVRSALATELFPYTARDLLRLTEEEQLWTDKLGQFSAWNDLWQEHGFTPMFRAFLRDSKTEKHLITLSQGERKLTNTLQLGELLQAREKETGGGMFELIRWLAYKRREPDEKADEEQLRLESDRELVKVVTMHRSKGLEYPIVYCPFLWDGAWFSDSGVPFLYHDPENGYQACLELNEKGHPERGRHRYLAALEEVSESLRLAYVAMTRAKQHCTLIFESVNDIEYSAMGYLLLGRDAIVERLKNKILDDGGTSSILAEAFSRALESLLEENSPLIARRVIDENEYTSFAAGDETDKPDKRNRVFPEERTVRSRSVISSFSSIMHLVEPAADDVPSDEFFLPEEFHPVSEPEERSIFSFPRGPRAGSCVHQIFEDLSFDNPDNRTVIINRNLKQFGFDTEWHDTVDDMIETVLQANLREDVRLDGLSGEKLVKEMEFYFDLNPFQREELISRTRVNGTTDRAGFFRVPEGFMKGYIDLVFERSGRFYILDYKTNYLGDEPADYSVEELKKEMQLAGYDVQYHIYSVALHRFLENRLKDYSYEKNFGGVFYLFIRGMGHGEDSNGIFFDRPEQTRIERLDELFGREGT